MQTKIYTNQAVEHYQDMQTKIYTNQVPSPEGPMTATLGV